jgi:hypothetical protein
VAGDSWIAAACGASLSPSSAPGPLHRLNKPARRINHQGQNGSLNTHKRGRSKAKSASSRSTDRVTAGVRTRGAGPGCRKKRHVGRNVLLGFAGLVVLIVVISALSSGNSPSGSTAAGASCSAGGSGSSVAYYAVQAQLDGGGSVTVTIAINGKVMYSSKFQLYPLNASLSWTEITDAGVWRPVNPPFTLGIAGKTSATARACRDQQEVPVRYLTTQEIRYVGAASCGPHLAPLMSALLDIETADPAVSDPDITADISSGFVDVEITVDAADQVAAMSRAIATLRAAIRATGDAAPGWETSGAVMHVAPEDATDFLLATA